MDTAETSELSRETAIHPASRSTHLQDQVHARPSIRCVAPTALLTYPRRLVAHSGLSQPRPFYVARQLFRFSSWSGRSRIRYRGGGGHRAVTHSLVMGLRDLRSSAVALDPLFLRNSAPLVALGGRGTADWVRSQLGSRECWFGPNAFVLPSEVLSTEECREPSGIIVPSLWVKRLYERDSPRLAGRIVVWPVGIDLNWWSPDTSAVQPRSIVLIVVKGQVNSGLTSAVCGLVRESHLRPLVLHYGGYTSDQYRTLLRASAALVNIGGSESQGIALLESWAVDVPTLVFYPETTRIQLSNGDAVTLHSSEFSAAPYLDASRGVFWHSLEELREQLRTLGDFRFSPRDSVLPGWDYVTSTRRLLEILLPGGKDPSADTPHYESS